MTKTTFIGFVEIKIYISLKRKFWNILQFNVLQKSKFTYLSNDKANATSAPTVLQKSKFTYLSNFLIVPPVVVRFCRNQNLHISQTAVSANLPPLCFVEIKIYISLKHYKMNLPPMSSFVEIKIYISLKLALSVTASLLCFVEIKIYISLKPKTASSIRTIVLQKSKFTYLSNISYMLNFIHMFCRNQNLHISQT